MSAILGRSKDAPDYGLGEVTVECSGLGLMDGRELTRRLVEVFESPQYQAPRLPAVATELLALSSRPDIDFARIEALLERDAMLAGEVLSVCQSPAYDRGTPISSLREALVRIGLSKLRGIVMQAAMSARVFRSKAYKGCMEVLQEHSRVTAHLARMVAMQTSIDAERAFLTGLLHDVGIAGILVVLGDTKRGESAPHLGALWPAIHSAHSIAGSRMVWNWDLPDDIAQAVLAHHSVVANSVDVPLAAVTCLAERLATEQGKGFVPPESQATDASLLADLPTLDDVTVDQTSELVIDRACKTLGLNASAYEALRTSAASWLASTAAV